MITTPQPPNAGQSPAYITNEGVAQRWQNCSIETVKRTARREGWTIYRMGGRVVRYLLADVIAYEKRCANAAPSHAIRPPKRAVAQS
jgi:hypothetical protein